MPAMTNVLRTSHWNVRDHLYCRNLNMTSRKRPGNELTDGNSAFLFPEPQGGGANPKII
jgi:hypothetical protein